MNVVKKVVKQVSEALFERPLIEMGKMGKETMKQIFTGAFTAINPLEIFSKAAQNEKSSAKEKDNKKNFTPLDIKRHTERVSSEYDMQVRKTKQLEEQKRQQEMQDKQEQRKLQEQQTLPQLQVTTKQKGGIGKKKKKANTSNTAMESNKAADDK